MIDFQSHPLRTSLFGLVLFLFIFCGFDMWTATGTTPDGDRLELIKKSPQWKTDKFENGIPEEMNVKDAIASMFNTSPVSQPNGEIPLLKPEFTDPVPAGLRVSWFGHSTLLIEIDGKRLLIDPVWGERTSPSGCMGPERFHPMPLEIAELPKIDAVLFSHDHYDHLDYPTIQAIKDWELPFIAPLGIGAHLEYWGVPAKNIVEKDWWDEFKLGELTLACTPARHFSGRGVLDRKKTLWAGWAILGPNHRVYYSGDTAMFPGFKEIGDKYGPFDIGLIESGAYNPAWADVHLGPEQAIQAHIDAKADLFLPVHWGSFKLAPHGWTEPIERVLVAAKARGVKSYVPQPGETLDVSRVPEQKKWWPDLPWDKAEEAPIISSGL